MQTLLPIAAKIAGRLIARKESVVIAESSAGGLISTALLSVPGASAYFLGGGVLYTMNARTGLLGITPEEMTGIRPSTEAYALLLARKMREKLGADWALARPAQPAQWATAMAMRRDMRASGLAVRFNTPSRWKPRARTARRICGPLQWRRWRLFWRHWNVRARRHRQSAVGSRQ